MTERPPFNQDIEACQTPESAYLFALEVEHMRVPDELKFDALREDIPTVHQPRRETLRQWKTEEEALRVKFYNADKNYLVALRLYYEMLLEPGKKEAEAMQAEQAGPHGKDRPPPTLPFDHTLRWKIVLRNRYLRLIDATHQAMSIAKAAHHEQRARRLRTI